MNNYFQNILVVENSIDKDSQDNLEKLTTSYKFPWFFSEGTILPSDVKLTNDCVFKKGLNPFQFVHTTTTNSDFIKEISPTLNTIVHVLGCDIQILKLKFNLLTKSILPDYHWPHSDLDNFEFKIMTALYYVNKSDGPTYLFNKFAPKVNNEISVEKTIDPEKGKMVIFDSRRFHSSSSPIEYDKRIVLNIVFKIKEE